jgi:hypothetical protein
MEFVVSQESRQNLNEPLDIFLILKAFAWRMKQ